MTVPSFIVDVLRNQQRIQSDWQSLAGDMWDNDKNLVFTNEFGKSLSAQTLYLHFKKIAIAIGRSDARFHDLRHSYAVAALQSGVDIKTVQENLIHHTAAFTLDICGHVTERMAKEAADRIESYYNSLIPSCKLNNSMVK